MTGIAIQDPAETDRVAALEACAILDTPQDEEFDFLARLAAEICGSKLAGITFIDAERQFYKSAVGLDAIEIPREQSFCAHTVTTGSSMVVEDTLDDDRFRDSPLVTAGPEIRFYAGAPLVTTEGQVLGALCVMDTEPRALEPHQLELLEGLAGQVTRLVERRRDRGELALVGRRLEQEERSARVAAWEWDAASDEANWSPGLRALLGIGDGVAPTMGNFMALVREEDRDQVSDTLAAALESGGSFGYRVRIVRPDGQERTLDVQGEVQLEDGIPLGMWGATVDVTELVEAERDNREQADGLAAAFETALDPILIADSERRYVQVNRAACNFLGYSRDQLLEMRVEDLVAEPRHIDAITDWNSFVEAGQSSGELEVRKSDGSVATVEFSGTADFVPGRHLEILRDVTERRRVERDALDSRQLLEETQQLTRVASWEWDLRTEFQDVSEEVGEIMGFGSQSRRPSYEQFIRFVHPNDRAALEEVLQRSLRSASPFRMVFRLITEPGDVRTIEAHGSVKTNEAGEAIRMVGAVQDVTVRERAAHDLRLQANVLDQVPAGVIASDTDRVITHWSHGAEVMFGIDRGHAVGRRFDGLGLIPPGSGRTREAMVALLGAGGEWEGEIELWDRTQRKFTALATNSPVTDEDGEITGYVAVTVDLTERQSIEKEVGLQGHLLDQVEAGVIALDPTLRITHWNRGAEKLFGWSREGPWAGRSTSSTWSREIPRAFAGKSRRI